MSQEKLIQASKDLFLRYGIKSVSMDDIARHLGVSKKTIYQYVDNKKHLIDQVFCQHIQFEEEVISNIISNSKDAIDELIQVADFVMAFLKILKPSLVYDLRKYHKDTWQMMETKHFQFIKNTMYNNLIRGMKEGLYRDNIEPDLVMTVYMIKMNYMINNPIDISKEYNLATIYKEVISQHMYGVITKDTYDILEQYLQKLNL